jgi:hypothetical protein
VFYVSEKTAIQWYNRNTIEWTLRHRINWILNITA